LLSHRYCLLLDFGGHSLSVAGLRDAPPRVNSIDVLTSNHRRVGHNAHQSAKCLVFIVIYLLSYLVREEVPVGSL
jgi:hypothetical protein